GNVSIDDSARILQNAFALYSVYSQTYFKATRLGNPFGRLTSLLFLTDFATGSSKSCHSTSL
ncbi:MAG: hypothetical protein RR135_01805, partial [Oscillospiraceae bacterium]